MWKKLSKPSSQGRQQVPSTNASSVDTAKPDKNWEQEPTKTSSHELVPRVNHSWQNTIKPESTHQQLNRPDKHWTEVGVPITDRELLPRIGSDWSPSDKPQSDHQLLPKQEGTWQNLPNYIDPQSLLENDLPLENDNPMG